jgi:cell division protein FtsB
MIQKTRKIKREGSFKAVFFSAITVILILFFVGFLFLSNWRIHQRSAELVLQIKGLEKEFQGLEKKNQELKLGFSQLSNEDYLEKMAREKLGLKKPGEEVVVVVPAPENEKAVDEKVKGYWQKILEKFGF